MSKTMVDIAKQIAYWRIGAAEDWSVGQDLISRGSIRQACSSHIWRSRSY
jgi:hypothetical protein